MLPASTKNDDDDPSSHRGSTNAEMAAALLDLSGTHGAPGRVGGIKDGLSPHSGSANARVATALLDSPGARGAPGGVGSPGGLADGTQNVPWP